MERDTRLGSVRVEGSTVVIELHFTNEDYPMDFAGELRLEDGDEVIATTRYERHVSDPAESAEYEIEAEEIEVDGTYQVVLNDETPTWGQGETREVTIDFEQ
ncbi:MAG: hypothetical protein V5A46_01815 [Haloferacaceae archaeon]